MLKTDQMNVWQNIFGKEYTDRNPLNEEQMNSLYEKQFGVTRSLLNEKFIGFLDRNSKIFEVGSNVGTQLQLLKTMGFNRLYGIELQEYAVEKSKMLTRGVNIIQGSAFDIPYKDRYFDMVFTSGVLIHINPVDLKMALDEIHRCCNRFIWGFEYDSEDFTMIPYRGEPNILWKGNYAREYLTRFNDLTLVQEMRLPYIESDNVDRMFLLEKQ